MTRKGLIVVDLQIGFNPSSKLVSNIKSILHRYDHVIFTRFQNDEDSLYRSVLDWHEDAGELSIDDFDGDGAIVMDKNGYGLRPEHIDKIKRLNCDEWHLCGMETDACVLACAFSLWDSGVRPEIITSLCESPMNDETMTIISRQFKSGCSNGADDKCDNDTDDNGGID